MVALCFDGWPMVIVWGFAGYGFGMALGELLFGGRLW